MGAALPLRARDHRRAGEPAVALGGAGARARNSRCGRHSRYRRHASRRRAGADRWGHRDDRAAGLPVKVVMREGTAGLGDPFVDLPRVIYADDPLWIPEEADLLRRAFSAANPWFASGSAVTMCIPGRARLAVFRQQG